MPYRSKAFGASDPTGEYVPVICTPTAAARLRASSDGIPARQAVNFRRDFLPLVLAEMSIRYYRQKALIAEGRLCAADEVTKVLVSAWSEGCFDVAVEAYAARYGAFDPERLLVGSPPGTVYLSAKDYETQVYQDMEDDVTESMMGAISPVKAANETLRVLRDTMRSVIEFQGLELDSYLDFQSSLANRVKSAVAGPPVRRTRELLALMDAGLVEMPFGPSPVADPGDGVGIVIRSTQLVRPYQRRVDYLVRGYLPEPTLERTRSPLLKRLVDRDRIKPLAYGHVEVGSIDLTLESRPIGRDGTVQERIWIFGTLAEGVRHFTHYVPSPKSRVRAFVDAEACAQQILSHIPRQTPEIEESDFLDVFSADVDVDDLLARGTPR
jgi:hypothetical protein